MRETIGIDEAMSIVRREARAGAAPAAARVSIDDALGRVLAREVISPIDSPPFDKSAMDGFALAAGDTSTERRILDTLAAGSAPGRALSPGECARIMTGAALPPGADRVIRKEYVDERAGIARLVRPESGDNVVRRAANLKRGQAVLKPKVLAAQDIGILAASGIAEVEVAVPLSTGIICTGPEIRVPGQPLGPGQIYDSNGPQLAAQLAAMRCPGRRRGIVADEPAPLSEAISGALEQHELVLLTGGVSAGDFDYVPQCLEELGAEILFHGVRVKPGKPTLFARLRGGSWVFGLPGNPVSSFVIFEVFVKPFLYGRMGIDWEPPLFRGTLGEAVRRRHVERTEYLPVRVRGGVVTPVAFHGSAHLNALGDADGLIVMPLGAAEIARGTEIDVRPI
jgi:molybdopterin molybdotransferase